MRGALLAHCDFSFNRKPQATAELQRSRLRLAVKRR
jgi:hypothetical protein